MTAQPKTKLKKLTSTNPKINSSKHMKLYMIAVQMKNAGLSDLFIVSAVQTALEYEGIYDLMNLWINENDQDEKNSIIADIQDLIDHASQTIEPPKIHIKFNDLEKIAADIRGFKDSLYQEIMKRGGVSKLSELTGIPQPSLSRFLNSNSMPRRATLLAIAKALSLDKLAIDSTWST